MGGEIILVVAMLVILILLGIPMAFSVGITAVSGLYLFFGGVDALPQIARIISRTLQDFVLTSVPLFILMSHIMLRTGVGHDLFEVVSKWIRHIPGGLGNAAVASCAIFAAISGSSPATVATIGTVAAPEMISRGYDEKLTYGILVGGGALGILIPPSIPMILYGSITDVSVGKLFIAGIIPGLLTAVMMIGYTMYVALTTQKCPIENSASWFERWRATRKAFWVLLAIPIILGSIYSGLATPTEAAGLGVVYTIIISIYVYRTITWSGLPRVLAEGAKTASMILFLVASAIVFGHLITLMQAPAMLLEFISNLDASPWVILILLNVFFFLLGMFLEPAPIILIVLPVLWPIVVDFNWDPIWFAIVMTINLELGCLTPPVGMNLYVMKGISNARLGDILLGSVPYAMIHGATLILVLLFSDIPLFLVRKMFS